MLSHISSWIWGPLRGGGRAGKGRRQERRVGNVKGSQTVDFKRLIFSLPISTFSALGVSQVMCSINYDTYLLQNVDKFGCNLMKSA